MSCLSWPPMLVQLVSVRRKSQLLLEPPEIQYLVTAGFGRFSLYVLCAVVSSTFIRTSWMGDWMMGYVVLGTLS